MVQLKNRSVAILVDNVDGLVEPRASEVTIRSNVFPGLDAIESIAVTDSRLLLIYDLATLLSWEEERAIDEAIGEAATTGIQ